jgi:hypothetical protein
MNLKANSELRQHLILQRKENAEMMVTDAAYSDFNEAGMPGTV